MKGITQNEFLQGVAFTHKFYEQKYKYGQSNEYGTYLVKQGGLMETLDIHTITETSFTVNELFFDTLIDVVVLFADCKAVENQPLTTNQPTIEAITEDEFLQGVEFTHAKYHSHIALCYEKVNFCNYELLMLYNRMQKEYTDTYIIANINESGFDIIIFVLDEKVLKTVLFADCFPIIVN